MKLLTLPTRLVRYWRRNGRYWTARKAFNAALAFLAHRLRLQYVPAMPVVAKIEATNACNGTCALCPVGRKDAGRRPVTLMPFDRFRALVDELKDTLVVLDVTNWGESLLHPRVLDMIRYGHAQGLYTYLSTNLHTVRPQHVEALMRCGLDELALSLHGLSDASYAAYQPGFDFAEACTTIERFVDARRRLARDGKPKIKINFVVMRTNEHEAAEVPAFARRLGVDYVLSRPSLNVRFQAPPELVRRDEGRARAILREQADRWLPRGEPWNHSLYERCAEDPACLYDPRKVVECDWPWTRLVVNADGGLSICCGTFRKDEDIAALNGTPLAAQWNSAPYRRSRAAFRGAGRARAVGGRATPCEQCPGVLL